MNSFDVPRFPLIAYVRTPLVAASLGWLSFASAQLAPSATQQRPMAADNQAQKAAVDSPYKPIPPKNLPGSNAQAPLGAFGTTRQMPISLPSGKGESAESQRALNTLMTAHTDAIKTLVNQVDDLQARVLQLEEKIKTTGAK